MKEASRAIIIGYCLPTDDVGVAMLLKRGLDHIAPPNITVVEYVYGDEKKSIKHRTPLHNHPVGNRFRSLFGPDIDWHTTGFKGWLKEQKRDMLFPFN